MVDKIKTNIVEDDAVTEPKIAAGAVDATALNKTAITGLSELTSVADNDELIIYDASADALKRVDKSNTTALDFPTYTSVSPTTSQTVDGGNITFTITGSGFTAGTNARLISNTGVRLNFDSVTRTNATTISATIARSSLLVAQSPYDIQVINGEGLSVVGANQISIDTTPVFVTSAGSLGSFVEGSSIDITVEARDPDSSSAVTFELQSGSLPAGLSLVNQSGDSCRITGTASAVSADTTSNFTLRAFDSASNTVSRAFSITIQDFSLNSARFDDGSSDYLNRTPSSASSRTTWTWSGWVKRSDIDPTSGIFEAYQDSSNFTYIRFAPSYIRILNYISGSANAVYNTSAFFRDPAAWYHIVWAWDTTNSTAADRSKLYVNGTRITDFSTETNPASSENSFINNNIAHYIGSTGVPNLYMNGYMSEIHFVDGTALTPTSFGETDSNGVWIPKHYSGSYGTNGFHLDFADASDLGDDESGNGNDFTENNLTSIDKTEDTPLNNYATMNPLDNYYANSTFSEGNLKVVQGSSRYAWNLSTIAVSSGKWYAEVKFTTSGSYGLIGITDRSPTQTLTEILGSGAYDYAVYQSNGDLYNNAGDNPPNDDENYAASYASGDIIGIALDLDNNKLYFSKNGAWSNGSGSWDSSTFNSSTGAITITAPASTNNGHYFFASGDYESGVQPTFEWNFGAPIFSISSSNSDANGYGSFEYAVPSGFYALNTKNLAQYG